MEISDTPRGEFSKASSFIGDKWVDVGKEQMANIQIFAIAAALLAPLPLFAQGHIWLVIILGIIEGALWATVLWLLMARKNCPKKLSRSTNSTVEKKRIEWIAEVFCHLLKERDVGCVWLPGHEGGRLRATQHLVLRQPKAGTEIHLVSDPSYNQPPVLKVEIVGLNSDVEVSLLHSLAKLLEDGLANDKLFDIEEE